MTDHEVIAGSLTTPWPASLAIPWAAQPNPGRAAQEEGIGDECG